jgi:formate hydrogenlyase subunit 6/NADH:ubiquinone oxidoreductase subunit I
LTLEREDVKTIADKAGVEGEVAQHRLDEMAQKGLIFAVYPSAGPVLYQAVPFVVGIYEFQVNRLSSELRQDLDAYWRSQKPRQRNRTIPQMRIIPVGESIEPHLEALPYEQVKTLVQSRERFAVAPCICRRNAKLHGEGCDAPEESCLMFDEFADFYVKGGMGRSIDLSEVLEILTRADAANLVLQPTNSQEIQAICCCCGCCCGILNGLKQQPKPAESVSSAFIASLDADMCIACWTCLSRCQMEALTEDGDRISLNQDRCIGCGLCVSTCPSGALKLERKPDNEWIRVPPKFQDTWRIITKTQTK